MTKVAARVSIHELVALHSVEIAALSDRLDAVARQLREMQSVGPKGPRDEADRILHREAALAACGLPWRARFLLRRADTVPSLAEALTAADLTTEKGLGRWALRMMDVDMDGVRLVRLRKRWWKFVVVSNDETTLP